LVQPLLKDLRIQTRFTTCSSLPFVLHGSFDPRQPTLGSLWALRDVSTSRCPVRAQPLLPLPLLKTVWMLHQTMHRPLRRPWLKPAAARHQVPRTQVTPPLPLAPL
jgi:hypothetical protein